ncbi:MAG: alpha/beta fold hydrolase [Chloroflexota bacterium]
MPRRILLLCFALAIMLFACAPTTSAPAVTAPVETPSATLTPRPTRTPTLTPRPTATMTYAQAIHPYTIAGLRARDYERGKVEVLGEVEKTDVFTSYLIRYPSDGLNIYGLMQVPAQGKPPFPVVVLNHGYFSRSVFVSGDGTDRAAEFLNQRGYLTLAPDYRSWGQSDFGPSLYYSGLAIDVVNLLQALDSIPEADVSRVGLWGHSMGGGVTMKVLTIIGDNAALSGVTSGTGSAVEGQTIVRAAVLYSTVSADQADVLARWGLGCFGDVLEGETRIGCNSSDVVPLDLPSEILDAYYRSSTDADMLRQISPIFHLHWVDVPVQIHYGTRDGEEYSGTPPEWSKKLYQALLDADKPAKLFGYEGEKHSFIGDAWFDFMAEVARFFDENVKNTP